MAESASAVVSPLQLDSTTFQYSIVLTDTGTTPLGTLWFAWDDVPPQDFLQTAPISVNSPAGWSASVTHGGPSDGFGIEWIAGAGAAVQAGNALSGFSFTSHDTPAAIAGPSVIDPTFAVTASFVYQGAPLADPGFNFAATVACFRAGTRIRTAQGDVPVEALRAGDQVQTIDGQFRAVTWIGHRDIDCGRHPRPAQVWPVRVAPHAFGPGMPNRALYLSPNHAVFVDEVLVPVRLLLNENGIEQVRVDAVDYYHVELDRHDVLLADGLPTESYLDTGDRANFENADVPVVLHPDFATLAREAASCAPLVVSGAVLAVIRRRLNAAPRAAGPATAG